MQVDKSVTAVVTGAASGLGRATAIALARSGAKVAVFDIDAQAGEAVAREIGGIFCQVDVMREDSVSAAFERARGAIGQERILVHCAMVARAGATVRRDDATGHLVRTTTDDYAFGVEGVLIASYRVASIAALGMAAAPALSDGERGVITLTSSVAAQDAPAGNVIYGSAKAGVNGLVLPMARDLAPFGIRVNAIMPGMFSTPLLLGQPQSVIEALSASVPFPKRMGRPEEFARFVLELVGNPYFNGQCLRLDGGARLPA